MANQSGQRGDDARAIDTVEGDRRIAKGATEATPTKSLAPRLLTGFVWRHESWRAPSSMVSAWSEDSSEGPGKPYLTKSKKATDAKVE
ncbi:MAG: hypothetical protein ACYDHP_10590 [Ferrimicrobium sp.]